MLFKIWAGIVHFFGGHIWDKWKEQEPVTIIQIMSDYRLQARQCKTCGYKQTDRYFL